MTRGRSLFRRAPAVREPVLKRLSQRHNLAPRAKQMLRGLHGLATGNLALSLLTAFDEFETDSRGPRVGRPAAHAASRSAHCQCEHIGPDRQDIPAGTDLASSNAAGVARRDNRGPRDSLSLAAVNRGCGGANGIP
jgi:hypothetical protein